MRFDIGVPSGAIKHFETWLGDGRLEHFAISAEQAGIDSVNVTDHPFPEDSWLANGGHQAFDPFVALSFMACVTNRVRLRTNLLVAGYRNPFIMARSIASLDRLSGGRVIVGIGAGYLKSEFDVLGADFVTRGARFDEALEAMTQAWSGESVSRQGGFYPVEGHTMQPTPVQRPRPPLWIGGNSGPAKRRASEAADGWIPMPANRTLASITGTTELGSLDELASGIREVRERREELGRTGRFDVGFGVLGAPRREDDPEGERMRELVVTVHEAGVTWISLPCRGRTLSACQEEMAWLGERVVAPLRSQFGDA